MKSIPSGEFNTSNGNSNKGNAEAERVVEPIGPLQPQGTGALWSGWWSLSGGAVDDKDLNKDTSQTARWYVDGIRGGKVTDTKLVKHLISLRVHLSTAKLIWIEEFSVEEHGMDALATLLAGLVGKGGKRKKLTDVEGTVLLEIIKCLRVLLNTEVNKLLILGRRIWQLTISFQLGFNQVLSSPTITTHIAYSLHTSSMRLRTLASELLAAICVLSVPQGHKAVLAAMSDYQVAYEESFRFELLIASLRLPDIESDGAGENENYSSE
jgi:diaphanous 1